MPLRNPPQVRIPMTWYPSIDGSKLPWALAYAPTEPFLKVTRKVRQRGWQGAGGGRVIARLLLIARQPGGGLRPGAGGRCMTVSSWAPHVLAPSHRMPAPRQPGSWALDGLPAPSPAAAARAWLPRRSFPWWGAWT
jgi:hypothetical protein